MCKECNVLPNGKALHFFLSSYWVNPTLPSACIGELHIYTATQREERFIEGKIFAMTAEAGEGALGSNKTTSKNVEHLQTYSFCDKEDV